MALTKDKFVLTQGIATDSEKMATESVSFWKDAWRRLKVNKPAMFGMWLIVFIVIMAIFGPMDPIVPNNADGTPFPYDAAPRVNDINGNELAKERISYVPARVPGLEKLGIFDGFTTIEIGTFDLLIGAVPKNDEFDDLKKPNKRADLVAKLGIKYHPYEINILDMNEEDGKMMVKILVLSTNKQEILPYSELVSEYSRFQEGSFEFIKGEVDDKGVEMVTVSADYYQIQDIKNLYFWFGTDKLAMDNWTRLWTGVRVSLIIALASLVIDFTLGIIYGTIAGFYGGTFIDMIMMRITEVLGSIPTIVLMIIFVSINERVSMFIENIWPLPISNYGIRLIILIVAMSLTGWIGISTVVRAQVLKLRDQEFVLASRTLGANKLRLMKKHLFPNIIGQIVVMATFSIPSAIFYEAFLTFIGLGLPIPMASLGVLVRDGYDAIKTIPTMLWIPAIVMILLMLSINLLANGLRDALDPRMR